MEGAAVPEAAGLKLLGMWASPFVHRVQLALQLKGLPYEYVEEDLSNKSPALLLLNPVHRKVPVLLHGDRAVAESLVILEYLDETWRGGYPLLPSDPLERAAVRFWCHFVVDKLSLSFYEVLRSTGDEQRAALREALRNLKLLEDELRDGLFKGRRFFGGDKMGFLDVVIGCGFHTLPELDEMTGAGAGAGPVELEEGFPCLVKWARDFRAQPEVREVIPDHGRLVRHVKALRQRILSQESTTTAPTREGRGPVEK